MYCESFALPPGLHLIRQLRIALAAAAIGLAGCATPSVPAPKVSASGVDSALAQPLRNLTQTQRINAWFDQQYEAQLRFSPTTLTFLGRPELKDQLDDFSIEAEQRQLQWQAQSVAQMQAQFQRSALDAEARRSWDLWLYQYRLSEQGAAFRVNQYVFDQMNGAQSSLPTFMINFHSVETLADVQAYIARLRQFDRALGQLLARAQQAAQQGIRPPRFAYEGVIEQSRKIIRGAPFEDGEDSSLWADIQAKIDRLLESGTLDSPQATSLKAQARAALIEHVQPAYGALIDWFTEDLPNTRVNPSGVASQPRGAAYYQYQLAANTSTPMTAEAIHQLGLDEVARLRNEMLALKQRIGFEGDLAAFNAYLNSDDPRFRYPDTDAGRQAYLDKATAVIANIEKSLPTWFGVLPKADLVVKRVEPFRERDGAAQHYYPGAVDGSRPGIYYIHLSDMTAMPKTALEVIAYHEGLPGHHMQISIAQELTGLPRFRTQSFFTAYTEGWGLYAEWLARQMPGTYRDPYSDFGRLTAEMWRAVRLVVDTGLHAKGWTEQQAVDYFQANAPVPLTTIRSEVQRYLIMPGQATAYKIGMIKIQQLRSKAEAALGEYFDIRRFHDAVLGSGALPLALLEQRIDEWIASERHAIEQAGLPRLAG
ncbi:DUF885 family protein [Sinimarinibacterium sp. NLF-5-8]|uniref:DUF885 domain-containing protein n=1 Tax=Sinimarinibacterium sp. NLF-5-8 TaxID=2698684 RepID=UPI00137C0D13|nr:DUF885 domain-containing protein [Sinimarinibacterium sp. NLF-5-8]QHS10500.1 DUF885 domain-containing protein [Sinimarinibacterium sp. NLF-5-8]